MSLIRLLDVSGIFHPLWRYHEAKGSPPGLAAEETVKALRTRAAATDADHVVACCDSGRSFRHAIGEEWREVDPTYKGYKANRSEKDAALLAALDRVISELEADGIPILRAPGFEADDIIATVAEWAVKNGFLVEIVSDDKDLAVLPRDAFVVMVKRDGTVIKPADVRAKFGVEPEHVSEMLAIMGDASDHVPGVKGIGAKQAPEVIYENGAYRGFLKAAEQARNEDMLIANGGAGDNYNPKFTPAMRRRLVEGVRAFQMSLRMTALRKDVPIDFSVVTAPRVPKPKPHSDAWKEQRERAATISATIAKEEQIAMNETNTIETPTSIPSSAKPLIVDAPPPASSSASPSTSAALALPKQSHPVRGARHFEVELEPRTYDEATLVAEHAADSKLFKDIGTPQQAIVLILLGRKFGLSAIDALRMIHMIEGKPCMSAQLIVGIVQKSGFAEYFEIEALESTHATWVTKRKGARREVRWTFTLDDAKTAKLGGMHKAENRGGFDPNSNWAKHPKVMCMWRAAVFLARAVYTDLVGGLYMPDEISGAEGEIDGNPPVIGSMGQAA